MLLSLLSSVWEDYGSEGKICGGFAQEYRGKHGEHGFDGDGDFVCICIRKGDGEDERMVRTCALGLGQMSIRNSCSVFRFAPFFC